MSTLRNLPVNADGDGPDNASAAERLAPARLMPRSGFLAALSRRPVSPFQGDPPRGNAEKPSALLLVSLIAIGLVVAAVTALLIVRSYRDTMAAATLDLQNRALILSEQADEVLYERELTRIRWHQAEIGRLQAKAAGPTESLDPESGKPEAGL